MGDRKHDIEKYLRGELSPSEMHELEKEALNDPFLAEALEGMEHAGRENFLYDLHNIRRSVRDRVHSKSRKKSKVISVWGWTTAIAATVLLLVVSGFIVLGVLKQQVARQQAQDNEPEPMPEEFSKKDTLVIMLPAETRLRRSASPATAGDPAVTRKITPANAQAITEKNDENLTDSQAVNNLHNRTDAELLSEKAAQQGHVVSRNAASSTDQLAAKRRAEIISRDPGQRVLKGKVVSDKGQALPGVNVMVKNSSIGAVTDIDGRYELSVPAGTRDVVFAFIGFESQEINIGDQHELNVSLKEDTASLSEVVVTGYGAPSSGQSTSTFRFAEPSGGRSDFNDYLAKSVQYPAEALKNKTEGRVTVRFTVQPNGTLTDFEVTKGIGSGCEEALIEAIKSGPSWEPSTKGDRAIKDHVKVRYRFKLPE